MAVDPADIKYFLQSPNPTERVVAPLPRLDPFLSPQFASQLNRSQRADAARWGGLAFEELFRRLQPAAREDVDRHYGLPWRTVMDAVAKPESAGILTVRNKAGSSARGRYQFTDSTSEWIAGRLGLPVRRQDGSLITLSQRPEWQQDLMFRELWSFADGRKHWVETRPEWDKDLSAIASGRKTYEQLKEELDARFASEGGVVPPFIPMQETLPSAPSFRPTGELFTREREYGRSEPGFDLGRMTLPTGTPLISTDGSTTSEDIDRAYKGAGRIAAEMLFGPQRESWITEGNASYLERFARDWGLSEQEFRTAIERGREGKPLGAAGWGLIGLASVIPGLGDAAQFAARQSGKVADVVRVTPRMPDTPQIGASVVEDLTPGLADNNAIVRGLPQEVKDRPKTNWRDVDGYGRLVMPGANIRTDMDGPAGIAQFGDLQASNPKGWQEAREIIRSRDDDFITLDSSFYAPTNPEMRRLFDEAAQNSTWRPNARTIDSFMSGEATDANWMRDSDQDFALAAFTRALELRAESQVYAHNRRISHQILEKVAKIPGALDAQRDVALYNARIDVLSKTISESNPMVQVPSNLLEEVLAGGLKNQFETGTSNGTLDFVERMAAESSMLGIPPQIGADKRPVYGYIGRIPRNGDYTIVEISDDISRAPEGPFDAEIAGIRRVVEDAIDPRRDHIQMYGDVTLVFDRSVLDDVTFTIGDSLGSATRGDTIAANPATLDLYSMLTAGQSRFSDDWKYIPSYFEMQYISPDLDRVVAVYLKDADNYSKIQNILRRSGWGDIPIFLGVR